MPGMYNDTVESHDGSDVYLTIDSSIQEALETSINMVMENEMVEKAWGGVIEIESGKILAYGQSPSFDPNELNIQDYVNYGSQYTYEPGSTFKAFVYAAAINEGKYDSNLTFDSSPYCYGSNGLDPYRTYNSSDTLGCVYNWDRISWGDISLDKGFIYSSNVGTSTLLTDYVGIAKFEEYLDQFGFFKAVDTDGILEEVGYKNYYYPVEKLTLTYGQGGTVTMLQMLQAYTAVLGNGEMVKPYIIDKIVDEDGNVTYQGKRTVVSTPITKETALKMQELMKRTGSSPEGDVTGGSSFGVEEVAIGVKTGTAEVADNGTYSITETNIMSVMVSLPADNPQYCIYFAFMGDHDAIGARYAPVQSLIRAIVKLSGIPTSTNTQNEQAITKYEMPNYLDESVTLAQNELTNMGMQVYIIGDGVKVSAQSLNAGSSIYTNEKIFLLTEGTNITIPSFISWTRKEVLEYAYLSGLEVELNGSGIVKSQSIAAGSLYDGTKIVLTLEDINQEEKTSASEEN